jgi:segregation and condensation protein A
MDATEGATEFLELEAGPAIEVGGFSGPLDLLLHLIKKNEVSIYDIPIVTICDQYHEILDAMQELDLDLAGEFLWMASWLLQLKSRLLLPRRQDDEEDPREELVERLLEYRRVKELAPDEVEVDWEDVDLRALAQAYLEAMERFAEAHPPPLHVLPLKFHVKDKMHEIYKRVCEDELVPLLRNLHQRSDSEEIVVMVVATLELVRLGAVCAEQRRPFAEIYLRRGSGEFTGQEITEESRDGA